MRKTNSTIIAIAVISLASTGALHAQAYPTKPIRLIVTFAPGGVADITARVISRPLSQALGQTIVVDNRPGGDGAIAAALAVKAAPDGYTLLVGDGTSMLGVPLLRKNPPYDPVADFSPITSLVRTSFFLVAHPGVPATTLAELIEYARANPRKLNYASSTLVGVLAAAQLMSLGKMEMVHVPYRGAALAMPDLLTGRVQLGFFSAVVPLVKEGKLRALVVLLPARSPVLPDVPTIAEAGMPGFSIVPWFGLYGPAKLPKTIVERISLEVNAVLKRPELREELGRQGLQPGGSTPEELAAFLKEQLADWRRTVREAGLKAE